jgi:hypothetical protein
MHLRDSDTSGMIAAQVVAAPCGVVETPLHIPQRCGRSTFYEPEVVDVSSLVNARLGEICHHDRYIPSDSPMALLDNTWGSSDLSRAF